MFDSFPAGQIQHLSQGIIAGETRLVLGDLAELTVQALHDIGRVYDFPNLGRICEKGAQNVSVIPMPLSLKSSEKTLKKRYPPLTKEKKYAAEPLEKKIFKGQKGWYTQQKSCAKS